MEEDPNYNPLPEDRPGGFDWGGGAPPAPAAQGPEENGDQEQNPDAVPDAANEVPDNNANPGFDGDSRLRARRLAAAARND